MTTKKENKNNNSIINNNSHIYHIPSDNTLHDVVILNTVKIIQTNLKQQSTEATTVILVLTQEKHMCKQSVFAAFTGLFCGHNYIINHCKTSGYFKPCYNRIIRQVGFSCKLRSCMKVKVIQTGIKLYRLEISIIIPTEKNNNQH